MIQKSTNLHFSRFIAAVLVIFSHSFVITQGKITSEWLYIITKGQLDFGALAVAVFFLGGGYLSAGVMNKYSSLKRYLTTRLVRILPALIFVVICCVLAGSIISSYSFSEYFENAETYRYLLNGFMILQHNLPGVFEEAVYTSTVNGSLWTLPVEFLCNIMCYLMFRLGFFDEKNLSGQFLSFY